MADGWHLLRNLGDVAERVLVGLSITIVKDFVATLRRGTPAERIVRRVRLGPRRFRRWFTCPPETLGENERHFLDKVLEASPSAAGSILSPARVSKDSYGEKSRCAKVVA